MLSAPVASLLATIEFLQEATKTGHHVRKMLLDEKRVLKGMSRTHRGIPNAISVMHGESCMNDPPRRVGHCGLIVTLLLWPAQLIFDCATSGG